MSDEPDGTSERWLCSDCVQAVSYDEYSQHDFTYGPSQEAEKKVRIAAILNGMARLAEVGHLALNSADDEGEGAEEGEDDGSGYHGLRPCDCCGTRLHGARTRYCLFPHGWRPRLHPEALLIDRDKVKGGEEPEEP